MGEPALRTLKLSFGYEVAALRERAAGARCGIRENTELTRTIHKYREVLGSQARLSGMENAASRSAKKCFKPEMFLQKAEELVLTRSTDVERSLDCKIRGLHFGLAFSKMAGISASAILGFGALSGGIAIYQQIIEKTNNLLAGFGAGVCFILALSSIPLGNWLVKNAYLKAIEKAKALKEKMGAQAEEAKKGLAHEIEEMKNGWMAALRG